MSDPIAQLERMVDDIAPISREERAERCEKARRLMAENHLSAVFLEPGPTLVYFTGVHWERSERLFGAVFPASGEPVYIVPGFEETRAQEVIPKGAEIRIWEEDEEPAERINEALRDRQLTGKLGIEESVRFFILDKLRRKIPRLEFVSADAVTAGCRMTKSTAELSIMTRANQVALTGVAAAAQMLREGMTEAEFKSACEQAMLALGCPGTSTITFGENTALPHGSVVPRRLKEGDSIVLDAVCLLHGYHADITRSFVFGEPSAQQRDMWMLERKAQDAGLAAVKPGVACEVVDQAARQILVSAGLGPDYQLPGLAHRTGHGIGLDVHEWPYLVRGNKRPLEPGMCFSCEPMIVIPGQFGVRLEDCFYVTENGAKTLTPQSPSLDSPFGDQLFSNAFLAQA